MNKKEILKEAFELGFLKEAKHAKDECMRCSKKPTKKILWAGHRARSWFCDEHAKEFKKEKDDSEITKVEEVEGGEIDKEAFISMPFFGGSENNRSDTMDHLVKETYETTLRHKDVDAPLDKIEDAIEHTVLRHPKYEEDASDGTLKRVLNDTRKYIDEEVPDEKLDKWVDTYAQNV